jgi:hypothetical protein
MRIAVVSDIHGNPTLGWRRGRRPTGGFWEAPPSGRIVIPDKGPGGGWFTGAFSGSLIRTEPIGRLLGSRDLGDETAD